jgi:AraC-like DNA-binding protein
MDLLTHFQADVLGDVLESIHLRTSLYCRAQLGAPWGLRVPRRNVAVFHIVTEGACWLSVEGMDAPTPLTAGDLVILPHGHAHIITDHPTTMATEFGDFVSQHPVDANGIVCAGGLGQVTTFVCGEFDLEEYATNPVFSLLPACLRASGSPAESMPWIRTIVKLVKDEARGFRPGVETVITRLSEILFIQAVRDYLISSDDPHGGWFAALKDPQIGQTLALIQRQPEEKWTVESLAHRAGLSRSAFSAKFSAMVGVSPLHYLTDVRLTKAAFLLRTRSSTLVEIARSVGYDSDVALSKAFKRRFGVAPGAYRRGVRSHDLLQQASASLSNPLAEID